MTVSCTHRIAAALVLAGAASFIQVSPGLAFSPEAQQMCTGDALRLCGDEVPDIPRITACMVRQRAKVSPECRAVMDKEAAAARKGTKAAEN